MYLLQLTTFCREITNRILWVCLRGVHRTVVRVRPYNCTGRDGYGSTVHRPSTMVSRTPNGDGTGSKTAVVRYSVPETRRVSVERSVQFTADTINVDLPPTRP